MRLITRGGYNLTDRYPWIVEATRKNPSEAVCARGRSRRFDDLVCRMHDDEVRLYAFDLHAWRARPTARVTADVADARPAQIPKAIHHGHPRI